MESSLAVPDRPLPGTRAEARLAGAELGVWIDQDLCTGDGICVDACPDVFVILEDGIAYVREGELIMNDPGGHTGIARVAPMDETAVIEAAGACPGECIFISPIEGAGAQDAA
ncbi:MAG: ferredoxin [Actinomycetota bacterium]